MKLNNKQRQSAVYSTRMINVYLRWLRGQKIRNGALKRYTTEETFMSMPKIIQKAINETWKELQKEIISVMPIRISTNYDRGEKGYERL